MSKSCNSFNIWFRGEDFVANTTFCLNLPPWLFFSPHRSQCMLRRIKFGFWINFSLLWNQFRGGGAHPASGRWRGRSWNWIVFRIREISTISTQRKFNQLIWADRSGAICRRLCKTNNTPIYSAHIAGSQKYNTRFYNYNREYSEI